MEAYDKLTGLYNRDGFFFEVGERLKEKDYEDYLILCSDVKNFKLINDVFGTQTGDRLLMAIAESILKSGALDGVYGRLENDKICVFIASKYKEQMIAAIVGKEFHIDGDIDYHIQIDVGIYEIIDRTIPVSIMCDRAMMAINTIKESVHDRVAYFDSAMRENALKEQELIGGLQRAIDEEELQIYLQPQTDCSGKGMGAEALVRWNHPEKGMLMPGEFIGIFEKNGMIAQVDRYIWELACRQLRKWKDEGKDDMYISVNISPKDFYFMDIYEVLVDLVKKYDIEAKNLRLEITETAVMQDLEKQLKLIDRLHAEGVETKEQVNFLTEIGCDMFQGYFFAKPMQIESFEKAYMN